MPRSSQAKETRTLSQLQNLVKRDPVAYREEFMQQFRHFQSLLQIFLLKPTENSKEFGDLVSFMAAVAPSYPKVLADFPQQIKDLLYQHSSSLDHELRQTLCRALILLRNRDMLTSTSLLELFFELFRCPDKALRSLLYNHIVSDIKRLNAKHKNNTVNKTLQNFMYKMVGDEHVIASKKSLDVMTELYHKGIWNDARTVNVLAGACFSKHTKVLVAALKFFLGTDRSDDDDEDEDDDKDPAAAYKHILGQNMAKKTRKRKQKIAKALKDMHRKERRKGNKASFDTPAIHLLNDPQSFSERLFSQLKSANERFEVRLMMMNLVSRLVGVHQLVLQNFYPFLQRYMVPHQKDVTLILTYCAQAAHDLVPSDTLSPVLLAIANNFVSEKSSPEAMAVGINAIREICARSPLAMDPTLLEDLIQYKTYRDKSVVMAARSLIQLFRDINPSLLPKKERGRPTDEPEQALEYGQSRAATFVPGTELLSMYEETKAAGIEVGEDDEWESASEDSDDDGEWITVHHDDDKGKSIKKGGKEEPEEEGLKDELTREEREARAKQLSSLRTLTDEDFAKIRQLQATKRLLPSARAQKRAVEEMHEMLEDTALLPERKKQRQNKEERLASVMEGREDRGKFGARKGRMNENASTTNREKARQKNPMMLRHAFKLRSKAKLSLVEKQKRKRKSLARDRRGRK
eukprot:m.73051 g.73051  ORF g.73051 m.73051 type:complete len:690 (-) comp8021_c0_seq2:72-2141(-)